MDGMGILTLLPLVIMLILVFVTRKIFESMLIPLALVYIMKDGKNFITGIVDEIYNIFAEGTYPWILLMLTLFGGLISLLVNSGGINGFRKVAEQYIKSERSSLVFTWVLGMILFIDDYINNLGIGPTVREISDEHGVPREHIAFSACSTGTPVCAFVPLTAFAVFNFGVMQDFGISPADSSILVEYTKVIPFLFYPLMILLVAFLLAVGILPKVGVLKKKYAECAVGGQVQEIEETEEGEESVSGGSVIDFLVPVLVVVVAMFITSDLVFSVILALVSCFVMYVPRKKMSFSDFFTSFFDGINDMIYILIIVLMTFTFVSGLNQIGFSDFVVTAVEPYMNGGMIPALTFLAVGICGFLGVDYWAVILLFAPVAIPLASQFDVNPYMTMGAIISGSVFGATTCFFAEQILMCSQSVKKPPVEVALSGLPYSILALCGTTVLFLIFGFAL